MTTETLPEIDGQYRALREAVGLLDRSRRGKLLVRGPEAAEYLQGQLTNDIEALEANRGCYAALLDRKGHLQADMRVLRLGTGDIWLDTEEAAAEALRSHLETYKIGRQVEIADESAEWSIASLIGPGAYEAAGTGPLSPEHAQRFYERDGVEVLAAATDLGVDLITRSAGAAALRTALLSGGAAAVSEEAAEILRVESGRPRFGNEMTQATMPAEAGIE
ncbi:MAG: YgfZ/GcvT domain-containing protein, partial [Solirubrobacterales bacterium]